MAELQLAMKPSLSDPAKKRVKLTCNLLPVTTLPRVLYHYHITIEPEIARSKILGLFSKLLQTGDVCVFSDTNYAFDGISMLVTDKKLKDDLITMHTEYGNPSIELRLQIQYKNEYFMNHLVDYMKGLHRENVNTHIQCLDVIVRDQSRCKYFQVGSRMFNLDKCIALTSKILIHVGLSQIFKVTAQGLHNNVDLSIHMTYATNNLIDVLADLSMKNDRSYSRSSEFDDIEAAKRLANQDGLYREFMALLKSVRVQTTHLTGKLFSFKAAG